MSDQPIPPSTLSPSGAISLASSGVAVLGGMNASEWGIILGIVGAVCAVVTCAANVYRIYRDIKRN